MQRISFTLLICVFVSLGWFAVDLQAAEQLVSINGKNYSRDDFNHWWSSWREPGMDFPGRPDGFVDFHLVAEQAREMEYFARPEVIRKVNVYLKVRTMAFLKEDEINSKVKISDRDVRRYFEENYSPFWMMQILTYDDKAKADSAYERLKPFAGQPTGRLVFADLGGVKPAENGPIAFEETKANPESFKRSALKSWLPVIRKMKAHSISEPIDLDEGKRFVIIRIKEIVEPSADEFDSKSASIKRKMQKAQEAALTGRLVKKLRKKYKVEVDEELLEELSPDEDYPNDYLEKTVISMEDMEVKVKDIIYNIKKDMRIRKGIDGSDLKKYMVNSIISQTLITKESLARHYEKKPPLKWAFDFYQQNRMRVSLEGDLRSKIEVSDAEIKAYYEKEKAKFGKSEKATFDLIVSDKEAIEKMWSGILLGSSFGDQTTKYSIEKERQTGVDVKGLPPELMKAVRKLEDGEVSAPFTLKGEMALIKLWVREPGVSHPLEQVRATVEEELRSIKFEKVKADYLDELKKRSEIKIKEQTWTKIKNEFEIQDHDKN